MPIIATYLNGNKVKYNTLDEAILNLDNIKKLNAVSNNLGDEDVKKLSKVLKNNQTLKKLNLWNNQISHRGIKKLVDALKINKTLIKLDLWHNPISEKGAEMLIELLETNTTISILYFWKDSKSLKNLISMLENNFTLLNLRINVNSCEISELLKRNNRLISCVADALIDNTENQSILHVFMETYFNLMRSYLIKEKNQTPEQADAIILASKLRYNPVKALFKSVNKSLDILPDDKLHLLAEFTLPKGHRAMVDAIKTAEYIKIQNEVTSESNSDKIKNTHVACSIL